jgi:hypothetical protein
MKKAILFLLIAAGSITVNAQSLKDLLYRGKLKKDSSSVIRQGDDLSSKIDTSSKKPAEPQKTATAAVSIDPSKAVNSIDPATDATGIKDSVATAGTEAKDNTASVKNNNKIWKEYMDSLVSILKTEVLPSKKIKKDTYYLYVEYEIGTDGQVTVTNVVSAPENTFLQQQVKDRLLLGAPQLSPVLDSSNKARKVKRKYNFNITKE